MDRPPFVIFGCGFTGTEVAKLALAAGSQVTGDDAELRTKRRPRRARHRGSRNPSYR